MAKRSMFVVVGMDVHKEPDALRRARVHSSRQHTAEGIGISPDGRYIYTSSATLLDGSSANATMMPPAPACSGP